MRNNSKIINFDLATELSGGDPVFAKELIGLMITSLPEYEKELKTAYLSNGLEILSKAAHKISGAASYTGTVPLQKAAKALENAAKNGSSEKVDDLYKNLLKEIEQVKSATIPSL